MNEQSTTFLEQRLGEALDAIATREEPTALTVAGLIESGRRRIRRRRARTAAGVSVSMVTAMAVTIGVVAGSGHEVGTASLATGVPRFGPAVMNGPMSSGIDPAVPTAAFGWLPADRSGEYEVMQEWTGPGATQVQVRGPGTEFIDAFVRGSGPGPDPGLANGVPAGLVQGHPAFWAAGAPGSAQAARAGNLGLAWQYEPGAWATLSLANATTSAANGDMLLKVARNLRIGPANPAALPFHLPRLPAGMRPEMVDIDLPHQRDPQAGYAALVLCKISPCAQNGGGLMISQASTTWMATSALSVDKAPPLLPGGEIPAGGVPVTVDGSAALLWTNANGATLSFTYGTAKVIIQAAGEEYQALGGRDGFLAFCRSLTWFGDNPARWTTYVLG